MIERTLLLNFTNSSNLVSFSQSSWIPIQYITVLFVLRLLTSKLAFDLFQFLLPQEDQAKFYTRNAPNQFTYAACELSPFF